MVIKVLTADIHIADVMIPTLERQLANTHDEGAKRNYREKYAYLDKLLNATLAKKNVKRGQKLALTKEEFEQFSIAISNLPTDGTQPGGSSANTLTTLSHLLGPDHVEVNFLGVIGQGVHSSIIRNGLDSAKIRLVPDKIEGEAPESAISFVFMAEDGSRTIATYPGNARKLIKPEHISEELIKKNDVIFVQGSLFEKLEKHVAEKLVKDRWVQDKAIWLALPTHAKFSEQMSPEAYRWLIPSADVVLGNDEELMRIYQTNSVEEAINALQQDIAQRDGIKQKEGKHSTHQSIAFITRGKEGAVVVTSDKIYPIAACEVEPGKKIYTLGAGDASFAGFLAGHIAGLDPERCGQLGMEVASAKLGHNSARLPNPHTALEQGTYRAKALLRDIDSNLGYPEQGKF